MSPAEPQTSSTTDSVVPFSSVRTVRDKHITRKLLSAVVGGVPMLVVKQLRALGARRVCRSSSSRT